MRSADTGFQKLFNFYFTFKKLGNSISVKETRVGFFFPFLSLKSDKLLFTLGICISEIKIYHLIEILFSYMKIIIFSIYVYKH